jgi:hypothetical protein
MNFDLVTLTLQNTAAESFPKPLFTVRLHPSPCLCALVRGEMSAEPIRRRLGGVRFLRCFLRTALRFG